MDINPDADTSHALVIRAVGSGKHVLELGSAVGDTTEALAKRGCSVIAVEVDPSGIAASARWAERVVSADLEHWDAAREFPQEVFDVVVAADVLEHLRNPEHVLRQLHAVLAPGGYVVASIPNIAHAAVRVALLGGAFDYAEMGLLDRTHVRFFTLATVEAMFHDAGFSVTGIERVVRGIDEVALPYREECLTGDVAQLIAEDPESDTFQFVVTAVPVWADDILPSSAGTYSEPAEVVVERLTAVADAMAREIRDARVRYDRLEREYAVVYQERDRFRMELEGVYGSRSWRVKAFLARRASRWPLLRRFQ